MQLIAYGFVDNTLKTLLRGRNVQTGDALTDEELNELAATMDDPHMCGRCGFGPVDHTGCVDLTVVLWCVLLHFAHRKSR